jgi:two-component system CheB/CheR fusion protein
LPVVVIVDTDRERTATLRGLLEEDGQSVEQHASCEALLRHWCPCRQSCLLINARLPGMSGLELLMAFRDADDGVAAVIITFCSDLTLAISAVRAGATDIIQPVFTGNELRGSVARALRQSHAKWLLANGRTSAIDHLAALTPRQRQVMVGVLAGERSKTIAFNLGISQRTVETHRASIMRKTRAASLPELARLAFQASSPVADGAIA